MITSPKSSAAAFAAGWITLSYSLTAAGAPLESTVARKGTNFELAVGAERVAEAPAEIRNATVQKLSQSPTRIATWKSSSMTDNATELSFYSVSLEGRGWSPPKSTTYRIRLKAASFDPLAPALTPAQANADTPVPLRVADNTRLYLVQFKTQVLEEYRNAIRELGGEIHDYVPELAHIVRMDAAVVPRVRELESVRYVGAFLPSYKFEKPVLDAVKLANPKDNSPAVDIAKTVYLVLPVSKADRPKTIASLEAMGAAVADKESAGSSIAVELTQQQVAQVAALDTVQWLERAKKIEVDVDNARKVSGADHLEPIIPGYTGKGIRGHVLEGIFPNHPDFAATAHRQLPIAVDDPDPDDHGQNTYGEIFGGGQSMSQARGFLPDAQGFYTNANAVLPFNPPSTARASLVKKLITEHRVMFQTASWGNGRTTEYTGYSADLDELIFDLDIPITQSQSNAGDQQSRPQAWAKNVISVGAVFHHDNTDDADDRWDHGASTGPAADGRVKPDLCSFFDETLTTDGPNGHTPSFGGTSGATPIVAGNVGLCLEMWTNGIFPSVKLPKEPIPANRFENRPHFTTVKALLIASAKAFPLPPTTDIDRFRQGWGRPDLKTLYELREKSFIVNEDDVLPNLGSKTYEVKVAPDEKALRVTMTYADPKMAASAAGHHRVNNLDLKATDPDGQIYWGNAGLINGAVSKTNGSPDTINTVENVILNNPKAGTWKIEVIADEVNADGHVETQALDADFALVVLGVTP